MCSYCQRWLGLGGGGEGGAPRGSTWAGAACCFPGYTLPPLTLLHFTVFTSYTLLPLTSYTFCLSPVTLYCLPPYYTLVLLTLLH